MPPHIIHRADVLTLVSPEEAERMMPYRDLMVIDDDHLPPCSADNVASIADIPTCLLQRGLAFALQHSALVNGDIRAYYRPQEVTIDDAVTISYAQWYLWLDGHRYVLCGIVDGHPHAYMA